jgi:hypothetical protein
MGYKNADAENNEGAYYSRKHILSPASADVKWRARCTVKAIHKQIKGFPPD